MSDRDDQRPEPEREDGREPEAFDAPNADGNETAGVEPRRETGPEGPEPSGEAEPEPETEGSAPARPPRPEMNLVVFLARAGVGSRRFCDAVIGEGRVTIDGAVVTFPREKVGPTADVAVDGEAVEPREFRYLLVNKPRGVASTRSDPHADRVLVDLVPDGRVLFPVGRLDVDTTGLIVLTNDGVLANRLMHPRYGVPKTYVARVRGKVSKRMLADLRAGVELEDGRTAPSQARLEKQSGKTALVELVLHEGRKRQVRRMLAAVGLPVEELHRRRYGPLSDKNLKVGGFRKLNGDEVEALRRAGEEVDQRTGGDDPGEPVDLIPGI
jgi:23S rRNA pseudouridine2605 synthase